MADAPGPGEDFTEWTAAQWRRLIPDADASAAEIAIRVMGTARAFTNTHDRAIRPWRANGVNSTDDFRTLGLLRHIGDGGLRVQHLADHLEADPGTVSSRVARLEKHGLVERIDDPSDGRAQLVRLVAGTEALVDDMYRALVGNRQRFFAALTPDERQLLADLLSKL